jgi:L-2-hydroxyglutarate oxidase LhgO
VTDFETIVVGAGVVGLAVAARLSARGSLLIVERHDGICRETSSRNSEVIHAGIYYPPGSLKARSCVRGKELLYRRCRIAGIPAPRVGKYIVGRSDQLSDMEELQRRAGENGAGELELIDARELRRRTAGQVAGGPALWSPTSGVVDSHAYAASFLAEAEANGATLVQNTEVVGVDRAGSGWSVTTRADGENFAVTAACVVNAAGLGQPRLSRMVGLDLDETGYRQHPCKGDYFAIAPRHRGRIDALVYPVGKATGAGLGVHLTVDTGGSMRLGPDWEYLDPTPPYSLSVDPAKRRQFFEGCAWMFPWLEEVDLTPELSGIRPKLQPPGGPFRDFVVAEESARGLPGWVTLAGIESPGLTAAAALAEEVERLS